jgi:hypothetical protein
MQSKQLPSKCIIAEKIQTNTKWLHAGILAIYKRQTEDEKQTESTDKDNGMGFTGCDARFGSSLAKKLLAGYTLTINQEIAARKMMRKYAGQLLKVAKEKADLTSPTV